MAMRSYRSGISRGNLRANTVPSSAAARRVTFTLTTLQRRWSQLHQGDREPFPDIERVESLGAAAAGLRQRLHELGGAAVVAKRLQSAWCAFHNGRFTDAIQAGSAEGIFGASVANKSAAIHALYARLDATKIMTLLNEAAERGESAVRLLSDEASVHYTLALVLGRYSQRMSILRALAEGMAERVRGHLERALALEPGHAEAHIALGLFHAEIVAKLGSIAAGLTYRASASAAIKHFEQASGLTPQSPIALMEYAHGLQLLDAGAHRDKIVDLYQRAAACRPLDAVDQLDCKRARRELAAL
jgi:tetratricopeptide (TPR) repeat protein